MKKILIPIDYSENAQDALLYGIGLAESFKAELYLLNVFQLKSATSFQSVEQIVAQEKVAQEQAISQLNNYITKIKQQFGRELQCNIIPVVRLGLTIEGVINVADTLKPNIIVMGTHGQTNLESKILGTNTAAVIDNVSCPVLTVPGKTVFKGWNYLAYAVDFHDFNLLTFSYVSDLAVDVNAKIGCFHINLPPHTPAGVQGIENEAKAIRANLKYENVEMFIINGNSVSEGINEFVQKNSPDVLVMAVHQRNLYQRIFAPSLTQKMKYHTTLPLLAVHIPA